MRVPGTSAVRPARRRGSILPLLAVSMAALIGFMALAIDLGMLVISRSQAQNAADMAALTAARTLTGDSTTNYNQSNATSYAQTLVGCNRILGQSIPTSQLQLSYGSYDYNQSTQTFNANFPATTGMPLTAVSATITSNNSPAAFSAVYGRKSCRRSPARPQRSTARATSPW